MAIEPEVGLSKETVYDGKLFKVYREIVRLPDGRERPREIVAHPGAVAMVVVDDEDRLILVRQYRRAADRVLLEIPAGTREPGEDPEQCALRDVRESPGAADEDENIEVVRLTADEAQEAIRNAVICDAKSICGILMWHVMR